MAVWRRPIEALSSDGVKELRHLQSENAKLREENERLRSVVSDGADNAREILAESRKLRELLLDYDKMLEIAADEIAYKSMELRMDSVLNALRIRMYELGIEVD
jgi:hypothetical protein